MDVLIDTNLILDVVQDRQPHSAPAKEILSRCIKKEINGFVTAHSLCDIFYILRKDLSTELRLSLISNLCKYLSVLSETQEDFETLSSNPDTKDLEDALQIRCAERNSLDLILTRNIKDFSASQVPAQTPQDFLQGS